MHPLSREAVIKQFHDLVGHVLKKFVRPGIECEDLVQEGFYGLLKAYDRYEPDRGVSFLTYAYPWVYTAMQTHVEAFSGPVHLSHSSCNKLRQHQRGLSPKVTACQTANDIHYGDNNDPFEDLAHSIENIENVYKKIDSQIVYEAIMFLPLTHQRILLSYFFGDKNFASLTEEIGLTKQRIHQIYKEAIVMLRKRLRIKIADSQ
jgi:RNA polymerase sigma factor (sigma-70 family)